MHLSFEREERARQLHAESIVLLAHDHWAPPKDLEELRQGGITGKILMAVVDARCWSDDIDDYKRSASEIDGWFSSAHRIYNDVLVGIESAPELTVIRAAEDVLQAKKQGKIGILLGSEGGKLIEHSLENLSTLYSLGLRHVLLSWAFDNQITAGELNTEGKGLTAFGHEVVEEMNRLGIIVDITHISRPAMREVLEISSRPVLNSHSTLKSISHRIPAMTEEEVRALARQGGVFALHFMTHMLTGRFEPVATLEELLVQIDAIVNVAGIDCLALGPDYLDYTDNFKRNTGQHNLTFPAGVASPAGMLNVTRGLVSRHYSDEAIRKILGGNLLRLFRDSIG